MSLQKHKNIRTGTAQQKHTHAQCISENIPRGMLNRIKKSRHNERVN